MEGKNYNKLAWSATGSGWPGLDLQPTGSCGAAAMIRPAGRCEPGRNRLPAACSGRPTGTPGGAGWHRPPPAAADSGSRQRKQEAGSISKCAGAAKQPRGWTRRLRVLPVSQSRQATSDSTRPPARCRPGNQLLPSARQPVGSDRRRTAPASAPAVGAPPAPPAAS